MRSTLIGHISTGSQVTERGSGAAPGRAGRELRRCRCGRAGRAPRRAGPGGAFPGAQQGDGDTAPARRSQGAGLGCRLLPRPRLPAANVPCQATSCFPDLGKGSWEKQCFTGRSHCWEHLRKGPRTKLASDPPHEPAMANTSTSQRARAAPSGSAARTRRLAEAPGHQCRSAPCRRGTELPARGVVGANTSQAGKSHILYGTALRQEGTQSLVPPWHCGASSQEQQQDPCEPGCPVVRGREVRNHHGCV